MVLLNRRTRARDFLPAAQPLRSPTGWIRFLVGVEHHPQPLLALPLTCRTPSAIHKASRAPWLSISLGSQPGTPRVPLVARSARPAGAARYPRGWRCSSAEATAASAAAPGGLRTRQAAGTRDARPFPRCHSDPSCLAPKPRPGLPQSKCNFLVSRQRNNAPEREGALRSQRLRLPRGPEASQAATPS